MRLWRGLLHGREAAGVSLGKQIFTSYRRCGTRMIFYETVDSQTLRILHIRHSARRPWVPRPNR
jgi:plasmid stabilization system protein ParE